MTKKLLLLCFLSSMISCWSTSIIDKHPLIGEWSLVSSTNVNDEYYQVKIEKNKLTRLYKHGDILVDNYTLGEYKVKLSGYDVDLILVDDTTLLIKDNSTSQKFQKITQPTDCFCIGGDFFYRKFNFDASHTNRSDTMRIDSLKNVMWEYFGSGIIEENRTIIK